MNTIPKPELQAFIDDNGDVRICLDWHHINTFKKEEYTPAIQAAVLAAWSLGCYAALNHIRTTIVPLTAYSEPFVEPHAVLPIHTCERPPISGFRHREKDEFTINKH